MSEVSPTPLSTFSMALNDTPKYVTTRQRTPRQVGGDRELDKLAATRINREKKNLASRREAYVSVRSL